MSLNAENGKEAVASRKLAAAELRKARKAARDPRNRLLSDSSAEVRYRHRQQFTRIN